MNTDMRNKTILKAAGAAVFAVMLCVGCYDLGIEPSVKTTVETFVDKRDGKEYKKVKIGEQVWMAENLKFAAEGSVCYAGYNDSVTARMCETYGRLYDWNTAMNGEHSSSAVPSGVEGVCPVDWHLPSDAEWTILIDHVGERAGTKLKSGTFHGTKPGSVKTPEGTDIYNFSALPAGLGSDDGGTRHFFHQGTVTYWWSATESESDSDEAYFRHIQGSDDGVARYHLDKHLYLASVRCVHD